MPQPRLLMRRWSASLLILLLAGLFMLTAPRSVSSFVREDPLEFHVVDSRSEGGLSVWIIEVVVGRPGVLASIRAADARQPLTLTAPSQSGAVTPQDRPRFEMRAPIQDGMAKHVVEYDFDGVTHAVSMELPPGGLVPAAARLTAATDVPSASRTATDSKRDFEPFKAPGGDISNDPPDYWKEIPALKNKASRDIRIRGRLMYDREEFNSAHPDTVIGAARVTVKVIDNHFPFDRMFASGITDYDGNFDFVAQWAPKLFDEDPDIYLEFETGNGWVEVKRPFLETLYRFQTGTSSDYTGTDLDFGTVKPSDINDSIPLHIYTNLMRAWRWSKDYGYTVGFVEAKWPVTGIEKTHYNPVFETIHLLEEDEWDDLVHVHEWGHHWTKVLGDWQTPLYGDDFAHEMWCEENELVAFIEGWANWISDSVVRTFGPTYGVSPTSTEIVEFIGTCWGTLNNELETEGFFTAVLVDIRDTYNEEDSRFPGDGLKDSLTMGSEEILAVAHHDEPLSTLEFLRAFANRYPSVMCDLWETARNCGIEMDDQIPGYVTGLTMGFPGGPAACAPPTGARRFTWQPAYDAYSCAGGYSVIVSTGSFTMPDATAEIGAVTEYTTACHGPGNYWFNIRAHDRSGQWSDDYAAYAFTISGPPVVVYEDALTAERTGDDIQLRWRFDALENVREYSVYRSAVAGADLSLTDCTPGLVERAFTDPATELTHYYRVVAFDEDGNQIGVSNEIRVDAAPSLPLMLTVRQNHPNPFSGITSVEVGLPAPDAVTIDIFDVAGRRVSSVTESLGAGWQEITLRGSDDFGRVLPSGVYFYRVRAGSSETVKKMVIAR